MPMRHRPFGIPEASLRQELRRRKAENQQALAPRKQELARQQKTAVELRRFQELLTAEAALLEEEQRTLLRELAEVTGRTWSPADPEPPPASATTAELTQTLRHYRALQSELTASVLSLIAPFLDRKEEAAWRSGPQPGTSGSGGL
ncbi:MAG TPA: hypothetical protein VNT75_21055 [Symbiobacteriaceae bacterium]|nr:hypothetical protein [Symbiobacteriaceae bacterium]